MSSKNHTSKFTYVSRIVYPLATQPLKKTPTAFTRGTVFDYEGFSETNINYLKRIVIHYPSCFEIHIHFWMNLCMRLITITNQCWTRPISSISNYPVFLNNKGKMLITMPLRMIWGIISKSNIQTLSKNSTFHAPIISHSVSKSRNFSKINLKWLSFNSG